MSCPRNCRSLAQSCIALCKVGLPFDQNQEDTHASSVGSGFDLCSPDSQSSRQECQVQDLQSLLMLSSLLLNRTGSASFTILFLLTARRKTKALKMVTWRCLSVCSLSERFAPPWRGLEDSEAAIESPCKQHCPLKGEERPREKERLLSQAEVSVAAVAMKSFGRGARPAGDEFGEALSNTLSLQEQLRKLQEELYHLRWSVKDVAERALHEALKQAKLPGFTGWAVQEIINQVLKKLEENQVPMPDYALKSSGAAVVHSRTSPSFRTTKGKVFFYSLPVLEHMRSPELILEPENHPGNCWPFPGSQGHVFVKLSEPIIPRAVTMDHVSGTAFHGDSISRAPKDFAVYGLKEEHEEQGTFLGQFTFQAVLNPRQTFQLKKELSGFANYVRLQVLSNWGHPAYTCLYRFRVHGDPLKDGGRASVLY
ncbi:LOW QUALITY PROTEIN: SUN domain-containing protein 3-like [Pelecanus crispus]|uniref:LOW QUALITY PROTEIN: SUN domain-containing protein 3-like n=1 Tax=Pelecanus crispus TaxID=36300 RepID=UPI003F5D4720